VNASELGFLLVGAFCVALGVVCGAIGDRVRYGRATRTTTRTARLAETTPRPTRQPSPLLERMTAESGLASDVTEALVTAGYPKAAAAAAVAACAGSERSTLEAWTRAALRRAGKGAPS
jgi:hypothetical protein